VDLLLIFVVSLVVLSGLDSHLWPQHATERRLFVVKLAEAERARRARSYRERLRRRLGR
jgi:hypothetical protein